MSRSRLFPTLPAAVLGVVVLGGRALAQQVEPLSTVVEVSLPGGLTAAQAAVGDEMPPDRAQFLLEFIRQTYDTPLTGRGDPRESPLTALLAEIAAASSRAGPIDTLPLPLPVSVWTDVILRGRATPQTLVSAILKSRNAALLYCGLLALDDETRAWLAGQPELLVDLVTKHAGAFMVAAPGLRVVGGALRLPGGSLANPVWQALAGRTPSEPVAFVRDLVAADDGRLGYLLGALSQLTPAQVSFALQLQLPSVSARVDHARRLHSVFVQVLPRTPFERRVFTRPALDPAIFAAELGVDKHGQPLVPGTRSFWRAAFAENSERGTPGESSEAAPPDFAWLCEQVFKAEPGDLRRRYAMVLFASRRVPIDLHGAGRDALDAVRAAGLYPALTTALERAGVTDITIYAAAARRAAALTSIGDRERAASALTAFQGALALVTRAVSRGGLTIPAASRLIASLSAVPLARDGEYDGGIACWLDEWLQPENTLAPPPVTASAEPTDDPFDRAPGPVERALVRVLAGGSPIPAQVVEWEGTRYRVDLAQAEAFRLTRAVGDSARPFLSSAVAIVRVAETLSAPTLARDALSRQAVQLADAIAALGDGEGPPSAEAMREPAEALRRAAASGNVKAASRLAPGLRRLADDLLAHGVIEWTYASALGQRDGVSIPAGEAAARHDFGLVSAERDVAPWRLPTQGTDARQRWRASGALLGLDVALADFSLVRRSARPPQRRPMLGETDRRLFIEAVVLVSPAVLLDTDRDTLVTFLQQGRRRLAAARTPGEALAIADAVNLSATRRSLLPWVLAREPARLTAFLSPSELVWLGSGDSSSAWLDAWGVPAGIRQACLCLQTVVRRPWETFAGRVNSGMAAGAFPDLNFRLAELLSDLRMPAVVLVPVLASATIDFVNTVIGRDPDYRRGLVDFVQTMKGERVEEYLALLTTDGPLVPLPDDPAAVTPTAARSGSPR